MTQSWITVEKFVHTAGKHCESTTLRDQVNFLGFDYSEAFMFGLDATLGFSFWGIDTSVSSEKQLASAMIMGGKQNWFQEKSLACRLLGINVDKRTFQRPAEAWKDAESCLLKQTPLMLQVDMGYLPFFQDLGDFHFGGHFISLIGLCNELHTVRVCDNNYDSPKEIPKENLEKARASTEGNKYMHPNNVRYVLQRRPDGKRPPLGPAIKLAIQEVVKNMKAPSMNQFGLPALKLFAQSVPKWKIISEKNPNLGKTLLQNLYSYIEEYGTGGAIFRDLYLSFLREIPENPEIKAGKGAWTTQEFWMLEEIAHKLELSCGKWHELGSILKYSIQDLNSIANLNFNNIQQIIEQIYITEDSFFSSLMNLKL